MGTPHVTWPTRTHGPPGEKNHDLFGALKPWVTCRQALGHLPPAELGAPIRLRWRGANGKQVASVPDRPARVVGTSSLSDGNVLASPTEATRRAHKPSKKPRASHADAPAGTVTTTNNGNGGLLYDGPELTLDPDGHPAARLDAPAPTVRGGGEGHSAPPLYMTTFDEPDHRPSTWDEPAATITRNSHSDGCLIELAEVDHHPPSELDEPSRTIRAGTETTPDKVLKLNGKHPISRPDEPSMTVCTKGNMQGAQGAAVLAWPWDRPSTTVCADDTIAPPGHHDESFRVRALPNAIKLSEKAAAILQGFPESWHFAGETKKARWSQIGQAMPPPLAEAVARRIRAWLDSQ
jgi:site-specific DNA-cytosine methylase